MGSITDLQILLKNMSPVLHENPYVFISLSREEFNRLSFEPLCCFCEPEGITVITEEQNAKANNLLYDSNWAYITLTVNSSLSAVGFLAVITGKLAEAGLSVNPVSAYYHDHIFVQWEKRNEVMDILVNLTTDYVLG